MHLRGNICCTPHLGSPGARSPRVCLLHLLATAWTPPPWNHRALQLCLSPAPTSNGRHRIHLPRSALSDTVRLVRVCMHNVVTWLACACATACPPLRAGCAPSPSSSQGALSCKEGRARCTETPNRSAWHGTVAPVGPPSPYAPWHRMLVAAHPERVEHAQSDGNVVGLADVSPRQPAGRTLCAPG